MTEILFSAFVYLTAAVIAVPLSKQLGLGSVLGYLIAGIAIGPIMGLVGSETESIQHVAEFGVVMMLFLVGLELEPRHLWSLRHKLLGLGGLQVGISSLVIFVVTAFFNLPWTVALAVGLILSLSSTAIVLQTLGEKGLMPSQGGQSSFSVLLFQDIAVIPMLALMPLLALPELVNSVHAEAHDEHFFAELHGWMRSLSTLGAIAFIVIGGQFLLRPLLRWIAKTRLREMFTATALLIVVGIAVLMSAIGLSPALGTFLAGVVLANSEYRHELESNIEPFKGLLLGLFFITVGARMDMALLFGQFSFILALTVGVILIKALVLYCLGWLFKLKGNDRWLFALALAQAGEFGFVLISFTLQNGILPKPLADQLLLVIALSMMLTPLLFIVFDRLIVPRYTGEITQKDDVIDENGCIIIAGNGRFGQIVNRLLVASGQKPTVIDLDAEAIEGFAKAGFKTYFGDATRPEILASAGIDNAKLLVVAIDDKDRALDLVAHARKANPELQIVARGYDRAHCYELYKAGAQNIVRETFDSAIRASRISLEQLGFTKEKAKDVADLFFHRDRNVVLQLAELYDPNMPRFGNPKMLERGMELEQETTEMVEELLRK